MPAPVVVILCFLVGGTLQHFHPEPLLPDLGLAPTVVSVLVCVGSLLIGVAGVREFHRHETPSNPFAPTTALVTSGIFRYTRNPMYLGFVLLAVGIALGVNSLWLLLAAVALAGLLQVAVIQPEERFLCARFGTPYQEYCQRTRRWL